MKISVISYDFWDYDYHIVEALKKRGIEAHHIKLGSYQHPTFSARLGNAFSKVFLKKNLKNQRRQEMILEQLKKIGKQDQILVVSPESIEEKYHAEIKKYTQKYIAYLYDALARNPAEKVLHFFDEIYSFDKKDIEKHGFKETSNYIYLPRKNSAPNPAYDLIYIGSYDERIERLYKIAKKLDKFKKKYRFIIVGKKSWKKKLEPNQNFEFIQKRISHGDLASYYEKSRVILDLVRENQSGLSFRIFEAMALEKKIITNNPTVKTYTFYDPANVLLLEEDLGNLQKGFFETPYKQVPHEIYEKYTLDHWIETVFNL